MRRNDLFQARRQSPWAIILILLRFVRLLVRQLWPLLLIIVLNRGDRVELWIGITTGIFATISLFGSALSYFRFYYWVDEEQLHIEKGLIRRVSIDIPFARIQTVDFEQNLIHQALKVVQVNIDSAGSKKEEISFDALSLADARQLRDYIMEQKAEAIPDISAETRIAEEEELILALTPGDLLKIGISQNHLRTAGIIFAAAWALLDNINQALDIELYDVISERVGMFITGSLVLLLIIIPVFLVVSFIVTLFRTILRYYYLIFYKTNTRFKLVFGLLNRKEKTAQKDKIQIISWSSNPIRKLFGIFHLRLYQASSVEVIGGKSFIVPGCYEEHIERTVAGVIPYANQAGYEIHGIHPVAKTRFVLFTGLIPCLALSLLAVLFSNWSLLWGWLYFPLSIHMAGLYFKKRKFYLNKDLCISESGVFGHQYKMMELYKIQAVKVRQSLYQLRKGLATIVLYTASGDISFPYIPLTKADELRDYLLYRIESDRSAWM